MDWIQVQGQSMKPFLNSGEWVGIDWCPAQQNMSINPGDLVLARSKDGTWVVHRVVEIDPDFAEPIWIKGDAAFVRENLSAHQVWGHVKAIRTLPYQEYFFSRNLIDLWIAFLLNRKDSPEKPHRSKLIPKLIRRGVILLSFIRRKMISLNI